MNGGVAPGMDGSDTLGVIAALRELIALRGRLAATSLRRTSPLAAPGSHATPHRSRGMEFAEARPYQPGDDTRTLDWRQTARRGRLYTKLFQEEHERPLHLLVDLGPSMRFGTRVAFKSVAAARAAAWLAWAAVGIGDRVGGLVCHGDTHYEMPPQGSHHGALALLRCLAAASAAPPTGTADLPARLRTLARTLRPGSRVVVISDFAALDTETERRIAALAGCAELLLLHVYDAFEAEPPPGRYHLTDGTRRLTLDLHSAAARAAYGAAFAARRAALEQLAQRSGARLVPLATHAELESVLPPAFSRPYRAS